jgi:predicted ATP-grasp superfamily ATP-dependent carboligase
VLLHGAEYVGVLAAVRALSAAGYEPWVATSQPGSYGGRSRAAAGVVPVPEPDLENHDLARALAQAAVRLSAAVVLPGTERGLVALARDIDEFPEDVAVGVCSPETVAIATDKALLIPLARAAGLDVPPTVVVSAAEEPIQAHEVSYPAVVKPERSELRTANGHLQHFAVALAADGEELRAALAALPKGRGVVQPYIEGRLGAVAGVFWDGEIVSAAHMVADRTWPPRCGTVSYGYTIAADPEFERAIGDLLGRLGWQGIFQIDYIERDGRRFLIDLNPRIYTWLSLAVAAGANLPAVWTALLLGETPVVGRYRAGVRYRHEPYDSRALITAFRAGARGSALSGLVPRPNTVHAIFSLRDPMPGLTVLGNLAGWVGGRIATAPGGAGSAQ